jgi:tRNA(Ile)-lysidine synthase
VLDRVLETISRYNMLPPGARVVVAVSGGPDSVCLLHLLREIGVPVAGIAHFNHKLRSEESDQDERFVGAIAARLSLPFYLRSSPIDAADTAGNLEQSARRARRDFFRSLIRDRAADRVALGHTRDDQAETVLFRILRGSGLAGLAGIHPVTADGLIRPLIEVTRAQIEEALRARSLDWREDSSNRNRRFARNRIRHDLLPQLARDWNPQVSQALANLADLAFEEERWWECRDTEISRRNGGIELPALALTGPRALARRLVRRAIGQVKGDLRGVDFPHVEQVIDLKNGHLSLPGIQVTRSFDWIFIALPGPRPVVTPVPVAFPGSYPSPDGAGEIRFQVHDLPEPSCVNLSVELAAPMELRGWRPGDHYRPVGRSRDQKIKEMFQNARVPSWRRPFWPILQSGGKILWARGFGAADEFCSSGNCRGPVLQLWESK